jgi:hypothetical protein
MNLIPFVIAWGLMATVVIALAVYRKMVAGRTDEVVHLSGLEASVVNQQAEMARKLELIDKWGKTLTLVALITGLALCGVYLYQVWVETANYVPR